MLIRPKGNIVLLFKETFPDIMDKKDREKFDIKNI